MDLATPQRSPFLYALLNSTDKSVFEEKAPKLLGQDRYQTFTPTIHQILISTQN